MTDRYLFRGKDEYSGAWEYGYYSQTKGWDCKTLHFIHSIRGSICDDYAVKPDTVGQCTGLRDVNDTLVYEGDILRFYKGDVLCFVVWNRYGWCVKTPVNLELLEDIEQLGDFRVVGNVHDNPELLEGGLD